MASIKILEKDYTRSDVYSATDTIVFIPGMIGFDEDGNQPATGSILNIPQLFSDVAEFEAKIGKTPMIIEQDSEHVEYDKSFVIAKQLIGMGMKVLYDVVGKDGSPVTTEEEIREVLGESTYWDKLDDRALYNVRFLTSGGYCAANGGDNSIALAMNVLAAKRGDCVALIDHPINIVSAESLIDLFSSVNLQAPQYATAFTPWIKASLSESFGDIVLDDPDGYWTLPGSYAYLSAYNAMVKENANWLAAAGAARGAIPTLVEPLVSYGEKVCEQIQSREEGAVAINPITYVIPYGFRIYGNRTLKPNVGGLKATSFLNIRNLISDIKKTCFQACRIMAFEQNTDILWYNLKAKITPTLDQMASNEGIRAYKVYRIATTEKAKVVGKVRIIPIEAVEDFEITIELVDSLDFEVNTAEE